MKKPVANYSDALILKLSSLNFPFQYFASDNELIVECTINAKPGSKLEQVRVSEGKLEVFVNVPPNEGKANKAICKILAKAFGIAASNINILKGLQAKNKQLQMIFSFGSQRDVEYYMDKIKKRVIFV